MKQQTDYNLQAYNTFHIACTSRSFFKYNSTEELILFLHQRDKRRKLVPLGGGSNILLTRKVYSGYFIQSNICDITKVKEENGSVWLKVGSGIVWDDFVKYGLSQGLSGLENLSFIPGTVGGSTVQNVGAYGVEASQYIDEVEAVDLANGQIKVFTNAECCFSYHSSIFAQADVHRYAITHVTYRLSRLFTPKLQYEALRLYAARQKKPLTALMMRKEVIRQRRSKLPDPKITGNAGSFFSNPVISSEKLQSLLKQYPDMPHYPNGQDHKVPAGWLIEHCGGKRLRYGKAAVYEKNALVLINRGGASATHILRLSSMIQKQVTQVFGINIHPEVIHL